MENAYYLIVGTLIALGVSVFVHELGHFVVAKFFGVGVKVFSLGFGPRIVGLICGETEYRLSLLPLGGYVQMEGEYLEDKTNSEKSFDSKPRWQKILIVLAGPAMNIIFAFLILFAVFYFYGEYPTGRVWVDDIIHESPAEKSGVMKKDIIETINGRKIADAKEISDMVAKSNGNPLVFSIIRRKEKLELKIAPKYFEDKKRWLVGITSSPELSGQAGSAKKAILGSASMFSTINKSIFAFMGELFSGSANIKENVAGPVGIAQVSGQAYKKGTFDFLLLIALININLVWLNLLPFLLIVDGGVITIILIEAIRRKDFGLKTRMFIQRVGIMLVLIIFLAVTLLDLLKLL